jgi:hypothetical protein
MKAKKRIGILAGAMPHRGAACQQPLRMRSTGDVALGHRAAFEADILEGVREGEWGIVHSSNQITDGRPMVASQV